MLAAYGVVAAYLFGALMNLSGWPFLLGVAVPGRRRRPDLRPHRRARCTTCTPSRRTR